MILMSLCSICRQPADLRDKTIQTLAPIHTIHKEKAIQSKKGNSSHAHGPGGHMNAGEVLMWQACQCQF